jgi:transposase
VLQIDPAGTSQRCSTCGKVVRKDLPVRVHACPQCGLRIDRDLNAALTFGVWGYTPSGSHRRSRLLSGGRNSHYALTSSAHRLRPFPTITLTPYMTLSPNVSSTDDTS